MERIRKEQPPFDEDNMCPMVAAYVLNKKNYEIDIPKANCRLGAFTTILQAALTRKGYRLIIYEIGTPSFIGAKLQLVRKKNDGVLLARNGGIFHFIAFIVVNGELLFYDTDPSGLIIYRLKQGASATDFDSSFHQLFPKYEVVQIQLIDIGGGRRRTRRRTRKHRRKQIRK